MHPRLKRVLLLSDPHFDFATREKAEFFRREQVGVDAIVVAGDVANSELHADVFFGLWDSYVCRKYAVPGNHDHWWGPGGLGHRPGRDPSFWELARHHGFVVPDADEPWTIVDGILLFGLWYPPRLRTWRGPFTNDYEYFDVDGRVREFVVPDDPEPVRMSVSHLSPNTRIPTGYEERSPLFYHDGMDDVLRAHGSPVHFYGHTHETRDVEIDGVRYVNRTIGYDDLVKGFESLEEFVVKL